METICSTETQHSQFGKMYTLSPGTAAVQDYWICHGHQSVLSWKKKNEPSQSSREQWWIYCGGVSRAHLVLLLFTSLYNHFSHQLHPVTKRDVFKAGGLTLKKF